jgi:hypothetical protein
MKNNHEPPNKKKEKKTKTVDHNLGLNEHASEQQDQRAVQLTNFNTPIRDNMGIASV